MSRCRLSSPLIVLIVLVGAGQHFLRAGDPATPQSAASQPSFTDEKITIQTGKYKLDGILTIPNGEGRVSAVVLVHGSGPHDADETIGPNKPFRDLADGLAARGIAVLRYEKRTLKYGMKMTAKQVTLKNEVIDDALSAVALARNHPQIDPARVFVLGHSLGGTCAPLIAARDKDIAGIILMSGTPRSLLDLVDEQLEYISNVDGKVTAKEQKMLDEVHESTRLIREGKYDEATKPPLPGAPLAYWIELHKLDVLTPARQLGKPMLILGGGRDYQVTEKCFEAWKTGLKSCSNVTYKWYKKNNHLMIASDEEGKCKPEEYFRPGHVSKRVIRDIAEWIKNVSG